MQQGQQLLLIIDKNGGEIIGCGNNGGKSGAIDMQHLN
jgi:hypothetical protein